MADRLGSLCAAHAISLYPNIRGLIIEGGIADFSEWQDFTELVKSFDVAEWILKAKVLKEIAHTLDTKGKISQFRGSTLVMHCKNDEIVPVSNANKLFDWANEPKILRIFNEGNHGSLVNDNIEEYCDELLNFIISIKSKGENLQAKISSNDRLS